MIDRDNDGIPDSQQLSLEELDDVDHGFGRSLIEIATTDKSRLARDVGRTKDKDFNPADLEFVTIPKPIVMRDNRTGKLLTLNYNRFIEQGIIELREEYSWKSGVMGPRDAAISSVVLSRLGGAGPFLGALLAAGGSAPALLAKAALGVLARNVKNKPVKSLLEQLAASRGALLVVLFALLLMAGPAFAEVLVLDHDTMLTQVLSKEPGASIDYQPAGVVFRTRRSALVGWLDVSLSARFERAGKRVQLVAQRLHVQALGDQSGKRFLAAREGLLKLVNRESTADRVEVWKADPGDPSRRIRVYSQVLGAPKNEDN